MSVIGISGRMGHGKNTVGDIIEKLCLTNNGPTFEQKSFAGKLKQIASLLTGIPVEMFEDQEFKKQCMSEEWNSFLSIDFPKMTGEEIKNYNSILVETTYKRMTYREFLQKLGTEAMRDGLHENVWVNALFADYRLWSDGRKDWYPNWIITDMRFPNEMEAVVAKGGITIRVVRSFNHKMGSKETGTLDLTPLHPSETALDRFIMHYEIINDGTLEDLVDKVRDILVKEELI